MRRLLVAIFTASALTTVLPASTQAGTTAPRVLVLHDVAGGFEDLGPKYAVMLQNLLGHFSSTVDVKPVSRYASGDVAAHDATFYIGTTYAERSYYAVGSERWSAIGSFYADAATSTKPVVWLGQNVWELVWGWDPAWGASSFWEKYSLFFAHLDLSSGYNRVVYKDTELLKGVVPKPSPGADVGLCDAEPTGARDCDTSLGLMFVTDPFSTKARVVAWATSTLTGARQPYVTKSGNFWYVGDVPFSYISEEDRYLAFADLLHDMIGIEHAESHRALVRLEDVSPISSPDELRAAAGVLGRHGAPFGLAVVPMFADPLKVLQGREPKELSRSDAGKVVAELQTKGADVVQHGTTHQLGNLRNPFNGLTGDDFEFFRVTENADHSLNYLGGVPNDSAKWAADRIKQGSDQLAKAKLKPAIGWEAPHYAASAVDYRAIAERYPVQWARVLYFPSGSGFVGQFFPYVVTDAYGQTVIPENLGNIEPVEWDGYPAWLPGDLIRRAKAAHVVRDGFASFFFHPNYDPKLLDETVAGIKALGYEFVRPCSVVSRCP